MKESRVEGPWGVGTQEGAWCLWRVTGGSPEGLRLGLGFSVGRGPWLTRNGD